MKVRRNWATKTKALSPSCLHPVLAVLGPEKSMVSQQIPHHVAGENLTGDRVARIVLQAAAMKAVMDESSYICAMPAPDELGKSLLPTSSILLPSYTPL
jgi:hypothetical protein